MLISFAVFIPDGNSKKIPIKVFSTSASDNVIRQQLGNNFSLRADSKRDVIKGFYSLLEIACTRYKKLYLMLSRFNSALSRERLTDKIIDITMSLESLVQDDKNELAFKFALYNAISSTPDEVKRMSAFSLLKNLYNARSTIVHGGAKDEAKEQEVVEKVELVWTDVESCAQNAINYQVFYMKEQDPKLWMEHMLSRALGTIKELDKGKNDEEK